jgi:Xaa-Pro aminopeptidase
MDELAEKFATVRRVLAAEGLVAARLRGVDWFAWATGGGSSVVLQTAETGVAELLISATEAWVLTDEIEAARLVDEELPQDLPDLQVFAHPWAAPARREEFVARRCAGGEVASDRPAPGERPLPAALVAARWTLAPAEVQRYRALGREAAAAVTEVLRAAHPAWTGHALAGAASEALWARGIDPALALVGDERRLPLYRHPTARREPLGARAMLVVCARRRGLYANLTRFLYLRTASPAERRAHAVVAEVEAAALAAGRPGATLAGVHAAIAAAYAAAGVPGAERAHHQGGPCGYLAREAVARPDRHERLVAGGAVAWNPSLPGAKIEDTLLIHADGDEVLTVDDTWPSGQVDGRRRPLPLER